MNSASLKLRFINKLLIIVPIFYCQLCITTWATAQTQQCFTDARAAYAYLIAKEQREQAIEQASIDEAWVNINTATEGELTTLAGIGSAKAQEIILYREMFGNFKRVEELTLVNGIGERTVEKNRERLRID